MRTRTEWLVLQVGKKGFEIFKRLGPQIDQGSHNRWVLTN